MGNNLGKPTDEYAIKNHRNFAAVRQTSKRRGSFNSRVKKVSKDRIYQEPTVLSFATPPLPLSYTSSIQAQPQSISSTQDPTDKPALNSQDTASVHVESIRIELNPSSNAQELPENPKVLISLPEGPPLYAMGRPDNGEGAMSSLGSSTLYSSTAFPANLSSSVFDSAWTSSSGLFSQIDPGTSTITTLTSQSTLSQHSLWDDDYNKPLKSNVKPINNTTPKDDAISTQYILNKLLNSPENAYCILKYAFEQAQSLGTQDARSKVYDALQAWSLEAEGKSAKVWIARCLLEGWGTPSNPSLGFSQLKELATDQECWQSFYPLGLCYLKGVSNNNIQPVDKQLAYTWFKTMADISGLKDPEAKLMIGLAQCRVGSMLLQGQGVNKDPELALEYFIKGAESGDKYAQYIVGFHYEKGLVIKQDISKANNYFLKSAEQGFGDAQSALGVRLAEELRYDEAIPWLVRASQMENPRALLKLGIMYETGQGVCQDNILAHKYYERASNVNDPVAQYILGLHYRLGTLGLERDHQQTKRFISKSAQAGFPPAQRVLGLMYAQQLISSNNGQADHARRKNYRIALSWFRRAASHGDVRALGLVGFCFEHGYGVSVDHKAAFVYYRKAVSLGGPFQNAAHLAMATLLHNMGRHQDAFQSFERISSSQDPPKTSIDSDQLHPNPSRTARLMMARYNIHGWGGIPKNPHAAFEILYDLASESQQDANAHYWLAACYEEGVPGKCEKQIEKAFEHYLVAANLGDTDAEFQIALMLANGQGIPRDRLAAFKWYKKAANKGHRTALYSLGLYYINGLEGITRNISQARECFNQAAQKGLICAMTALATLYRNASMSSEQPETTTDNQRELAVQWFQRAASLGDAVAQRELGLLHDAGLGVPKDYIAAFDLFQKAAAQQDAQAVLLVGSYYQNGLSVEKDIKRAIEYYVEASRLGAPVAPFAAAQVYHTLSQFEEAYTQYQTAANDVRLAQTRIGRTSKLMVARYVLSYVPSSALSDDISTAAHHFGDHTKEEAFQMLYKLATNDNFEPSFYWLGDCYRHGNGVAIDVSEAVRWFKKAADETKDVEAMLKVANLYERGAMADEDAALRYYRQSAESGHAEGQYRMGMAYWHGLYDTHVNLRDAIEWFTLSAAQKYSASHWALGQMAFENGDLDVALAWWEKAVELRHVPSMRALANILLQTNQEDIHVQNTNLTRALQLLADGARAGDLESFVLLGQIHQAGTVTASRQQLLLSQGEDTEDLTEEEADNQAEILLQQQQEEQDLATKCFEQAAAMGHVGAMFFAAQSWHAQQQYCAALELYERAADQGHLLSRVMRARYRLAGLGGIEHDPETGYNELLVCARDDKCVDAYNSLGQCHEIGLGVPQDDGLALHWYIRSAQDTKDAEAMFRIGQLHAKGRVGIQSETETNKDIEALRWYRLACDTRGHSRAHYYVGLYHINGVYDSLTNQVLLQPDINVAAHHFQKAAEQNEKEAMFELGQILLGGDIICTIEEQLDGVEWLERAAQLGSRDSQRELGTLYHTGKTREDSTVLVLQDFEKAFDLFCRAAQQKDATSALFLGRYHQHGIHIPPNLAIAKEWYAAAVKYSKNEHTSIGGWWVAELVLGQVLHQENTESSRAEAYTLFKASQEHAPEGQKEKPTIMVAQYELYGWGNVTTQAKQAAQILIQFAEAGETSVYLDVARCYEVGLGVDQDLSKSFSWYGKIVAHDAKEDEDEEDEEGLAFAFFKLAEFYRTGLAVPMNLEKSNDLYRISAEKGSQEASRHLLCSNNTHI
ncbi:hypothetical protein CLU79DRAFT_832767 [Phycomyces nitens]|nr:hypothetical protein CLU79DRAFT_832767 [Phycomyces nitens]